MMFINKIPFLTTISKRILCQTAEVLSNHTIESLEKALHQVFLFYHNNEFAICTLSYDREIQPIATKLAGALGIKINPSSAQEYVPEIEQTN